MKKLFFLLTLLFSSPLMPKDMNMIFGGGGATIALEPGPVIPEKSISFAQAYPVNLAHLPINLKQTRTPKRERARVHVPKKESAPVQFKFKAGDSFEIKSPVNVTTGYNISDPIIINVDGSPVLTSDYKLVPAISFTERLNKSAGGMMGANTNYFEFKVSENAKPGRWLVLFQRLDRSPSLKKLDDYATLIEIVE